jgi:hypothetical protein
MIANPFTLWLPDQANVGRAYLNPGKGSHVLIDLAWQVCGFFAHSPGAGHITLNYPASVNNATMGRRAA